MNSNWRNRPTTIEHMSQSVNYLVGIDESGSANLKQVQKAKRKGIEPADSEKHFMIIACAINNNNLKRSQDRIMEIKNKYWKNGLFDYRGEVKRVCFHSREIRGKKGAFNPQLINYNNFINDLSLMMSEVPIKLYASHINKWEHVNQYSNPYLPYDLCMTFVLERIVIDIKDDETCVIVLESRGANEDKELLDFIKNIIDFGTQYVSAQAFKKIKGVYFNPKWCKCLDDKKSYWILELADLCVYPFYKYYAHGRQDQAFETLLPKLSGYPRYIGVGLKSFL